MVRSSRALVVLLALVLSSTAAGECRNAPDTVMLYKAFDAKLAAPDEAVHEPTIESYAQVIREGDPKKDRAAIDLSCALMMRMLKRADRFESDSALYEGCPAKSIELANASNIGHEDGDYLPLIRVAPVYPARALQKEATGIVVFQFTVNEEGRVVDERVLASTDRMFENSARKALRKFRYKPRVIEGTAYATPGVILTISFSLVNGDGETLPPYTRKQECD